MSGLAVVLGDDRSPHETRMQVAGHGCRIGADALREAMRVDGGIRDLFLLYALACAAQGAATILANARFGIEERLARWLLMCHDRLDGDTPRRRAVGRFGPCWASSRLVPAAGTADPPLTWARRGVVVPATHSQSHRRPAP